MKFKTRFGTTLQSTFRIMIRISNPPICVPFYRNTPVNEKHIEGYVIEILNIIWNVLRIAQCNSEPIVEILNLMSKFTTFVGQLVDYIGSQLITKQHSVILNKSTKAI